VEEASQDSPLNIHGYVLSDLGNVRSNNEDNGYFFRPHDQQLREKKGFLGIVADGMGGYAAGEIASELAVNIIKNTYYQTNKTIQDSLKLSLENANQQIFQKAQNTPAHKGMGTTCTAVVICENRIFYAHIGDSRLYHLHNGKLNQISNDHTYVNELLKNNLITVEQASSHPERNILTRAMGTKSKVEIDVESIDDIFEDSDRLLLCSDGLYEYFRLEEIETILIEKPIKEASVELIETAKMRGGHDNITTLIIEYQNNDRKSYT
jgi:PPM family protein phosphatase